MHQRERSIFSVPIVFRSVAFDSFHRDYLTLVWPWRADAIQIKQSVRKTYADKGERNPSRKPASGAGRRAGNCRILC
jgi:hypothetical protein